MNYIIKTVQACNLSCVYCYERAHNRRNLAMRLDDVRTFMQKVRDYYLRYNPEEVLAFHWHGGEPTLMGAGFFEQIIAFQTKILGTSIRWYNTMQSNLTLLDDAFLELFQKQRSCLLLGVSFDFFGDDRVDSRNRNVNARVWRNVKRLQAAGIPVHFLTMLTRGNVEHLDEIYELVRSQEISIQFNQIFGAPSRRPFQRSPVRLRNTQFSQALERITRKCLSDNGCVATISNVERVMRMILDPDSTRICWYQKNCLESHMAICPDGTVFPCDSVYLKELSYGNIFQDPYEQLLASEPRKRLLREQKDVRQECKGCEYLDFCNGGCPSRSLLSMRHTELCLHKDPLCAMHRGLFAIVGKHLVDNGLVRPDWAGSHLQRRRAHP